MGDGSSVKFWDEKWAREVTFKNRYPRLYQLCVNKDCWVGECGRWVGGRWSWEVPWRRTLLEREKAAVEELYGKLRNITLIEGVEDGWAWEGGSMKEFTVKEAYGEIVKAGDRTQTDRRGDECFKRVWKTNAPFKAQVMGWRLLWNRLPTRDKVAEFIELEEENRKCCCCKVRDESADDLFILCPEVDKLWSRMVEWIGAVWAPPRLIRSHFLVFSQLMGGGVRRRKVGGLWICVVWVLWRWRNQVVFEQKECDWRRIEEEIRCRYWTWLAAVWENTSRCSYLEWSRRKLYEMW